MNKTITVLVVSAAMAVSSLAMAGEYGMAGCGLGAIVMGPDGGQTSAATTNGSFGSQLFGITSGTSECIDADTAASLDQEAFLLHNYASISKDAAGGEGQYLAAFATVLGCSAEAQPAFFSMSKRQHAELFTGQAPRVVLQQVKTAALQDAVLKASCARI